MGMGGMDHIARHGNPGVPVPAALSLEREIVPSEQSILAAINSAVGGTR